MLEEVIVLDGVLVLEGVELGVGVDEGLGQKTERSLTEGMQDGGKQRDAELSVTEDGI